MNKKTIDKAVAKKIKQVKIYIYIYIIFFFNSYLKRRDVFNPNDSFISSTAMVIQIPLTLIE